MLANLPELAADRLPVLEEAYMGALALYAEIMQEPRAALLLWAPRQVLELRLCQLEQTHDEAAFAVTHRLTARGTLRARRADLVPVSPVPLPQGVKHRVRTE